MEQSGWEHFDHQADIGIRGFGGTTAEAFEQCALSMMALVTDPSQIGTGYEIDISCKESDPELLLVDWLNKVIFEMVTRKMIFGRFEVSLKEGSLSGKAWGEPINVRRHQPAVEIKGATYTELALYQSAGRWIAQCVVDI